MKPIPAFSNLRSLVIASHNQGKIDEFSAIFEPLGVQINSALALQLPDVEETGLTFEENAALKAIACAKASNTPALGDDSGLMIDALAGAPGIYTARWAETDDGTRNWDVAMGRAADELRAKQTKNWAARFVCVLALALPNGETIIERGEVAGNLIWPVRGTRGFGYDPMFVPTGHTLSFGEMDPAKKNAMSHRYHAFAKLLARDLFG